MFRSYTSVPVGIEHLALLLLLLSFATGGIQIAYFTVNQLEKEGLDRYRGSSHIISYFRLIRRQRRSNHNALDPYLRYGHHSLDRLPPSR